MAQQLSYTNNPPAAINGMEARSGYRNLIDSKVAQGTVPIGCLATLGTTSMSVPAPLISTGSSGSSGTIQGLQAVADNPILETEFYGVPIYDAAVMQSTMVTTVGTAPNAFTAYLNQMPVPVMRKGWVWVLTEGAVSQLGNVFVRTGADGIHQLGQFSGAGGAGLSQWNRGRWLMTLSAQGLALLEIW